ncbi:MAG: serine/threonine protein kinase, partial [Actinomycetia bacterium]|nr:serine/threonine protein kinase [Actinomycetes bacterium]
MADIDLDIPGLAEVTEIGRGGFATVYSALEVDAGRYVAVKVLDAVDDSGRRRFDRERRTMGQTTDHTNIVTMFRSGYTTIGNRPFLVMEYMAGGSLRDQLDRGQPLPWPDAIKIVAIIADALAFAHEAGIVHRDVKPANILVSSTGVVKLGDFGIAAIHDSTATSQVALSPSYAP